MRHDQSVISHVSSSGTWLSWFLLLFAPFATDLVSALTCSQFSSGLTSALIKVKVKTTLRLTVSQSVSKSWYRAPSEAHDQIVILFDSYGIVLLGALSHERAGPSFVYATSPCQCSLSRVRVPWDSRPYFTVSELRLPCSSPPMICRVTVTLWSGVVCSLICYNRMD
jgi:hypothetical protein